MALELWILAGLAGAVLAVAIIRRVSGSDKRDDAKETKNVYPLW
jgi:hypothetical protein